MSVHDRTARGSSLAPVPSESSTCANCSAPLVADQRYCLSCGQPCSPVRLAFLDVLESERQQLGAAPMGTMPGPYGPYGEPARGPAWLRRYTPLLGVMSVLLLAMIIGLLVGHWVTQNKAPSRQVIKVEGLSGAPLASTPSATPTSATAPPSTSTASTTTKSSAKEQKQEEAEAKAEEKKAPVPPKAVKVNSGTLSKLTNSTGKKHQEEINKIGTAPIEVP
jgi:hypothetical protein